MPRFECWLTCACWSWLKGLTWHENCVSAKFIIFGSMLVPEGRWQGGIILLACSLMHVPYLNSRRFALRATLRYAVDNSCASDIATDNKLAHIAHRHTQAHAHTRSKQASQSVASGNYSDCVQRFTHDIHGQGYPCVCSNLAA